MNENLQCKCEKCGAITDIGLVWINPWWPHFECEYTELWLCALCEQDADAFMNADQSIIDCL